MDFSQTIIKGRITSEPETVEAGSTTVTKFGVAVKRVGKNDKTDFYNVKAWGKTGEFVENHLAKGLNVMIVGRMEFDRLEGDDGVRYFQNLVADKVVVVEWPNKDGEDDLSAIEGLV